MSNIIIILLIIIPLIVLVLVSVKLYDESKTNLCKGFYYYLPHVEDETFHNLEFISRQKDYCTFKHLKGYEVRLDHKHSKLLKLH